MGDVTITRLQKPATIEIRIKVDSSYVDFIMQSTDIFGRYYSGYWACGMEHNPRLGWLLFEHGDEVKPPREVPEKILRAWRDGDDLPKRWYRVDRATALLAFAEGVKLWGATWTTDNNVDGTRYDVALQRALFGTVRYG